MSGYSGLAGARVASDSAAVMASLEQCTSFDWHGLKGDDAVVRVGKGQTPQGLVTSERVKEAMGKLGKPVNDMRSVNASEWKPSDAELFKQVEGRIMRTLEEVQSIKPTGPKMS